MFKPSPLSPTFMSVGVSNLGTRFYIIYFYINRVVKVVSIYFDCAHSTGTRISEEVFLNEFENTFLISILPVIKKKNITKINRYRLVTLRTLGN